MSQLREDICYPSIFYPEKKFEHENYYYYESLSLNSNSKPNQAENIERSTYESSAHRKIILTDLLLWISQTPMKKCPNLTVLT